MPSFPAPLRAAILCLWWLAGVPAGAAPYLPASDAQVIERVPARVVDARVRDLQALRAAWRASPDDAALAVRLARR